MLPLPAYSHRRRVACWLRMRTTTVIDMVAIIVTTRIRDFMMTWNIASSTVTWIIAKLIDIR